MMQFLLWFDTLFVRTNGFGVAVLSTGGILEFVDFTNKSIMAIDNITNWNLDFEARQVRVCSSDLPSSQCLYHQRSGARSLWFYKGKMQDRQ